MVKSAFAGRAARIRHPAFQISPPSSPLSVPYPHPYSARRGATRHESSALAVPRRRRRRRSSFATDNWIPRATPAELQIFPSRENFLAGAPLRGDIPRRLYRLRSAAFLSTVREKKDRYVGTEPPLPLPLFLCLFFFILLVQCTRQNQLFFDSRAEMGCAPRRDRALDENSRGKRIVSRYRCSREGVLSASRTRECTSR